MAGKAASKSSPCLWLLGAGCCVQVLVLFIWLCFKSPSTDDGAWHGLSLPMDLLAWGSLLTCLAKVGSLLLVWGGRARCGLSL